MVYRVIGKMKGEGQGYVLGFRQVCNLAEWIAKGWKENEITFVRCVNKTE